MNKIKCSRKYFEAIGVDFDVVIKAEEILIKAIKTS